MPTPPRDPYYDQAFAIIESWNETGIEECLDALAERFAVALRETYAEGYAEGFANGSNAGQELR